jgi:hypothetical protein
MVAPSAQSSGAYDGRTGGRILDSPGQLNAWGTSPLCFSRLQDETDTSADSLNLVVSRHEDLAGGDLRALSECYSFLNSLSRYLPRVNYSPRGKSGLRQRVVQISFACCAAVQSSSANRLTSDHPHAKRIGGFEHSSYRRCDSFQTITGGIRARFGTLRPALVCGWRIYGGGGGVKGKSSDSLRAGVRLSLGPGCRFAGPVLGHAKAETVKNTK